MQLFKPSKFKEWDVLFFFFYDVNDLTNPSRIASATYGLVYLKIQKRSLSEYKPPEIEMHKDSYNKPLKYKPPGANTRELPSNTK